jgi:lactoylglutathione lyase
MKLFLITVLCASVSLAADAPQRPKITGVAHIALWVHDIEKSRAFYKDFLGFGEPFKLENPDGTLALTFIKVNDRQYLELFPEKEANTDRLNHISIETDNAEAMRAYLAASGVKTPDKVGKGRIGNANFNVTDPDGHTVEIVQYEPDGWSAREKGKYMDGPRISKRIAHLGITVRALEPSMKFYCDLLGFQEIWRGSKDGKQLDWVNLKAPDSDDYLELMLYDQPPSLANLGTMNHISLEAPDMDDALAALEARPARKAYSRPLEIRTGVNRKRQLNIYDPDGTRTELMEPHTIDGKPAASFTAPAPR